MKTPEKLATELRDTCSDPHPKGGIMLYPDAVADFLERLIIQVRAEERGLRVEQDWPLDTLRRSLDKRISQ